MDRQGRTPPNRKRGAGSAYQSARIMMVPMIAAIVFLVVMLIMIPFSQGANGLNRFRWAMYPFIFFAFLSMLGIAYNAVQDRREIRAGYTTAVGVHRDFNQIEPVTGKIVRRAGEPFMTAKEYRALRAELIRQDNVAGHKE